MGTWGWGHRGCWDGDAGMGTQGTRGRGRRDRDAGMGMRGWGCGDSDVGMGTPGWGHRGHRDRDAGTGTRVSPRADPSVSRQRRLLADAAGPGGAGAGAARPARDQQRHGARPPQPPALLPPEGALGQHLPQPPPAPLPDPQQAPGAVW